ncbi:MAG: hypothetical protein KKG75_02335 [Nanoarchaeota archaeon]|nr:hypothetical protein [Nanoarchaeota archaeon]
MKLIKTEKIRIDAYMEKCAENMKKAGGSEENIVNAYYRNEAKAMSVVLGETRPNLTGWWNTEEETTFSEKIIKCAKCGKTSDEVETMVNVELNDWHCNECIGDWSEYKNHPV